MSPTSGVPAPCWGGPGFNRCSLDTGGFGSDDVPTAVLLLQGNGGPHTGTRKPGVTPRGPLATSGDVVVFHNCANGLLGQSPVQAAPQQSLLAWCVKARARDALPWTSR